MVPQLLNSLRISTPHSNSYSPSISILLPHYSNFTQSNLIMPNMIDNSQLSLPKNHHQGDISEANTSVSSRQNLQNTSENTVHNPSDNKILINESTMPRSNLQINNNIRNSSSRTTRYGLTIDSNSEREIDLNEVTNQLHNQFEREMTYLGEDSSVSTNVLNNQSTRSRAVRPNSISIAMCLHKNTSVTKKHNECNAADRYFLNDTKLNMTIKFSNHQTEPAPHIFIRGAMQKLVVEDISTNSMNYTMHYFAEKALELLMLPLLTS